MNETKSDLDNLFDQIAAEAAERDAFVRVEAMTQGFVPSEDKDELGVPYQSFQYGVAKCNTCWGKGYVAEIVKAITYTDSEGRVRVMAPVEAKSGRLMGSRLYKGCQCQWKGYKKARLKAEAAAIALENQVKKAMEEAYKAEGAQ